MQGLKVLGQPQGMVKGGGVAKAQGGRRLGVNKGSGLGERSKV